MSSAEGKSGPVSPLPLLGRMGEGRGVRAMTTAPRLLSAPARPGPCSSSGCTNLTRFAVPSAEAQMKVVSFIEPPQGEVIERILRHCGLWNPVAPRAPPGESSGPRNLDGR